VAAVVALAVRVNNARVKAKAATHAADRAGKMAAVKTAAARVSRNLAVVMAVARPPCVVLATADAGG